MSQEALESNFRDDTISNMVVMFLRLVVSCEVQRREDFFAPFIMVGRAGAVHGITSHLIPLICRMLLMWIIMLLMAVTTQGNFFNTIIKALSYYCLHIVCCLHPASKPQMVFYKLCINMW